MIIITRAQLEELGACEGAINLFAERFGEKLEIPEYTPSHQEWLLRSEWRKYANWIWTKGLLPKFQYNKTYRPILCWDDHRFYYGDSRPFYVDEETTKRVLKQSNSAFSFSHFESFDAKCMIENGKIKTV